MRHELLHSFALLTTPSRRRLLDKIMGRPWFYTELWNESDVTKP